MRCWRREVISRLPGFNCQQSCHHVQHGLELGSMAVAPPLGHDRQPAAGGGAPCCRRAEGAFTCTSLTIIRLDEHFAFHPVMNLPLESADKSAILR